MRIIEIKPLQEMAKPKQICPKCGNQITGYHYWYKGGWKCKSGAGTQGSATSAPPTTQPVAPSAAAPVKSQPASPEPAPASAPPVAVGKSTTKPASGSKLTLEGWLAKHNIENYQLKPDGSIDVDGDVHLDDLRRYTIPVKFGNVTGTFSCSGGLLNSVENGPDEVGGSFLVDFNELTSLNGGPTKVGGTVSVTANPLESFEGFPSFIGKDLVADELTQITSLRGIHKHIKNIGGSFSLKGTPIKESVLGLLLIRNLQSVTLDKKEVEKILNKYLSGDRDVNLCQDELIDAGLDDYASL